jgi:hypothetical protein
VQVAERELSRAKARGETQVRSYMGGVLHFGRFFIKLFTRSWDTAAGGRHHLDLIFVYEVQ